MVTKLHLNGQGAETNAWGNEIVLYAPDAYAGTQGVWMHYGT